MNVRNFFFLTCNLVYKFTARRRINTSVYIHFPKRVRFPSRLLRKYRKFHRLYNAVMISILLTVDFFNLISDCTKFSKLFVNLLLFPN